MSYARGAATNSTSNIDDGSQRATAGQLVVANPSGRNVQSRSNYVQALPRDSPRGAEATDLVATSPTLPAAHQQWRVLAHDPFRRYVVLYNPIQHVVTIYREPRGMEPLAGAEPVVGDYVDGAQYEDPLWTSEAVDLQDSNVRVTSPRPTADSMSLTPQLRPVESSSGDHRKDESKRAASGHARQPGVCPLCRQPVTVRVVPPSPKDRSRALSPSASANMDLEDMPPISLDGAASERAGAGSPSGSADKVDARHGGYGMIVAPPSYMEREYWKVIEMARRLEAMKAQARLRALPQPRSPGSGDRKGKVSEAPEDVATRAMTVREGTAVAATPEPEDESQDDDVSPRGRSTGATLPADAFNTGYYERFFREEKQIGRGAYGGVFLSHHALGDVLLGTYAVKKIPVGDNRPWLMKVLLEVRALERLHHGNMVDYKHSWLEMWRPAGKFGPEVPCLFILMEYANCGSLADFIWPRVDHGMGVAERARARRKRDQVRKQTLRNLRAKRKENQKWPHGEARLRNRHGKEERTETQSEDYGDLDEALALEELERWEAAEEDAEQAPEPSPRVLSENVILRLFLGICNGLQHLHSLGWVHQDVKPENLLLTSVSRGQELSQGVKQPVDMWGRPILPKDARILISDLGESRVMGVAHLRTGNTGTLSYCAPEVLSVRENTSVEASVEGDIWSLGVVLYAMAFGVLPWEGDSPQQLRRIITTQKLTFPDYPARPPEVKRLISDMLTCDPAQRPSLDEIIRRVVSADPAQFGEETAASSGTHAQRDSTPHRDRPRTAASNRPQTSAVRGVPRLSLQWYGSETNGLGGVAPTPDANTSPEPEEAKSQPEHSPFTRPVHDQSTETSGGQFRRTQSTEFVRQWLRSALKFDKSTNAQRGRGTLKAKGALLANAVVQGLALLAKLWLLLSICTASGGPDVNVLLTTSALCVGAMIVPLATGAMMSPGALALEVVAPIAVFLVSAAGLVSWKGDTISHSQGSGVESIINLCGAGPPNGFQFPIGSVWLSNTLILLLQVAGVAICLGVNWLHVEKGTDANTMDHNGNMVALRSRADFSGD